MRKIAKKMALRNRNVLYLASIFLSYYYISGAHSLVSTNIASKLQIRYKSKDEIFTNIVPYEIIFKSLDIICWKYIKSLT